MEGSTVILALGADGIMQRWIRFEDHKFSVDNCVAGGVCRLLDGSNLERVYRVWTSELLVSELKHAVVRLVEALSYKKEGRGFDSWCWHWEDFSLAYSFRPHNGPLVDSASKRNEYQEYSLVGKDGQHGADITTFICWLSRNLRALNPWNPQGLYRDIFSCRNMFRYCKCI